MQRSMMIQIGAALLVLLSGGGLLAITSASGRATSAQERGAALGRWQSRDFNAYRMVLEEGNCTTDFVVRNERVAWAFEAPCGRGQARSVSSLFTMIEQGRSARVCIGANCACQWVTTVNVDYDTTLGYPHTIVIRTAVWPNWRSGNYWSELTSTWSNPCDAVSERVVRVKALTPRFGATDQTD
jgi:hypothetical protein